MAYPHCITLADKFQSLWSFLQFILLAYLDASTKIGLQIALCREQLFQFAWSSYVLALVYLFVLES